MPDYPTFTLKPNASIYGPVAFNSRILNCARHVFSYITNVDEIYDFSFQNKEETPISMILNILYILVQFAIGMNKYKLHFVVCYMNALSRS